MDGQISAVGWEQGSLLADVGDAFLFAPDNPLSAEAQAASDDLENSNLEIAATVRQPAPDQLSILITHTCDIVKPPTKYPRVEVLRCYVEEDRGKVRDADTNSARYFLVDPEKSLVADASTRTSIEKAALLVREPIAWPSNEVKLRRFREWLGSRYTRPIDPEEVVQALNRPIVNRVRRIRKQNPDLSETLDLVKRIQVFRRNTSEPYDITLVFFVEEESWEDDQKKIPSLFEDLRAQVSQEEVNLSYEVTTEARISLKDYLATTYFDLDSYSYEGEDVVGSEPVRGV